MWTVKQVYWRWYCGCGFIGCFFIYSFGAFAKYGNGPDWEDRKEGVRTLMDFWGNLLWRLESYFTELSKYNIF